MPDFQYIILWIAQNNYQSWTIVKTGRPDHIQPGELA
jgi:hypothetical protein